MIRIKRTHLNAGILTFAAILGWALGYAQDNLTQRIPESAFPLLVVGVVGWFAYVLWHLIALKVPSLRLQSLDVTRFTLAAVVIFWLATIIGGVSFFLINGMDYMTLWLVLAMSTFTGTAYNFAIVVLPLLLIRLIALFGDRQNKMGR